MTLFLRFSLLLYVLLILLHSFAALAVAISAVNDSIKAGMFISLLGSGLNAYRHYGPTGKKRWQQCQLGETACLLVSAQERLNCKPVLVGYFSECLIILVFEAVEESSWNCFQRFHSLLIAPDSLDSRQQARLRRFLLFGV